MEKTGGGDPQSRDSSSTQFYVTYKFTQKSCLALSYKSPVHQIFVLGCTNETAFGTKAHIQLGFNCGINTANSVPAHVSQCFSWSTTITCTEI